MHVRCVFPLLLALGCATPPAPPFAVECVDADGAPVSDVGVTFHTDDEDGSTIVFAEDESSIGFATVTADARDIPVIVRMTPGATVHGRVQVPEGHTAPVHVSVVHMYLGRDNDRRAQSIGRAWSPALHAWLPGLAALDTTVAPDGTFSLRVAQDASAILAFTSAGLEMTQRWARHVGGEPIELLGERRVEVTILDEFDRPIAGADVRLFEPRRTCGNGMEFDPLLVSWRQRTHADGTAVFDGLPLRICFVSLDPPDGPLQLRRVECTTKGTSRVMLRVDPGILVRGFVRDDEGHGVAGVAVIATAEPMIDCSTTRTDANGAYQLRVPRNTVFLRLADAPKGHTGDFCTPDFGGVEGDTHTLDFVLRQR